MRWFYQSLGLVVAAGLGLIVGYFWRGGVGGAQRPAAAGLRTGSSISMTNEMPQSSVRSGRRAATRWARADSPLATQLDHNLSLSSRVTRWLHWIEAIEQASLADFPRLAGLAKGDATATRLLAMRWVELDLQHLYHTLEEDRRGLPAEELAEVLFQQWARRDPDAAVAALRGTNGFGTRENLRFIVAGLLVEKDPERGLRALSEWGIDDFGPRMTGVSKWAATNPRHAAEVVLANPAGYTSQLAIETIGKEWAKTDPVGAIEFAASKPGEMATELAGVALKNWAGQHIEEAAAWLARAEPGIRRRLSPAFVQAWAKTDPDNALAWCEASLTGGSLAQTVGLVMNSAARRDLSKTAAFVTQLKVSSARAEAAAAVARHWFPSWRSGKPVPAEAIAWLGGLDPASTRRAVEQVQWKWSNGDPQSMAEFLAATSSDKVPLSADLSVARALTRQNPLEAIAWASRLPADRTAAAGQEALAEWRRSQPESAEKWLNELPTADPRREIFRRKQNL